MVVHNSLQVWLAMSEQLKIVCYYWGDVYRVYWYVQVMDFAHEWFVLSDILYECIRISSGFLVHQNCQFHRKMESCFFTKTLPLAYPRKTIYSPDNFLAFFLSVPDTSASDFAPAYCGYSVFSIEIVWRPQANFTKVCRQELHVIDSWALSVCFRL